MLESFLLTAWMDILPAAQRDTATQSSISNKLTISNGLLPEKKGSVSLDCFGCEDFDKELSDLIEEGVLALVAVRAGEDCAIATKAVEEEGLT